MKTRMSQRLFDFVTGAPPFALAISMLEFCDWFCWRKNHRRQHQRFGGDSIAEVIFAQPYVDQILGGLWITFVAACITLDVKDQAVLVRN